MQENQTTHFNYPQVDDSKCVGCGLCEKLCPGTSDDIDKQYVSEVYAAVNSDQDVRFNSASGGMFGALANYVLETGGVVVGAKYLSLDRCEHVLVQNKDELKELYGTKYFQSDIRKALDDIKIKSRIGNGIIMFCGTPCQVEAVRRYAKQYGFYDRLFTVGLLCRGVPSYYLQKKYIEHLENKYKGTIVNYRMKEKSRGWHNIGIIAELSDGRIIYEKGLESCFGRSFMNSNYAIRPGCFNCKFKSLKRNADITIGDFWGYGKSFLDDNQGTSAVMISSDKGADIFNKICDGFKYKKSTLWRVYKGNLPAFTEVSCDELKRDKFFELLNSSIDLGKALDKIECME